MKTESSTTVLEGLKYESETSPCGSYLKRSYIGIGILLGIIIFTTVLYFLFALQNSIKSTDGNNDLCSSPYCIKAANHLINSIDQSADPCDNFYQFACGTYLKNNETSENEYKWKFPSIILDENIVDLLSRNETVKLQSVMNARILYSSCINQTNIEIEGIDPVLSLINTQFGGWPILQGSSWNSSTFNLTNLLFKLHQYNYDFIFSIASEIDEKNSSATTILIRQGTLALLQRQYYANETNITIAYRQFIYSIAKALTNDTSMIDQDIKEIFDFEKNISKYHWTNNEQRVQYNKTIRTTISNLSRILKTSFDFTTYLHHLYLFGNVILNEFDLITIKELDFLINVVSIIDKTSSRIIQNYFIWRFIMSQSEYMPKSIRNIKEQFDLIFQATSTEELRTIKCAVYVNKHMGFVVSKLYIKNYFDENAHNQSLKMLENIQNSFIDLINQSYWMDDKSKMKTIEKVNIISLQKLSIKKIAYPDYLVSDNNTKLENDYSAYVFNSSYIHNSFKIHQIKAIENFQFLRKPVLRKAWPSIISPTTMNAYYAPSQNQIIFPTGILQMPFFHKDAPKYLNYGGIGTIIGHEITHGFDDTGRQFDKDGNRIAWWTNETIEKFNNRKQCFIEQYSNFSVPEINMNSNGNQTQDEDIADNGGLKAAFYAYQKWAKNNVNVDKKLPGLTQYSTEKMFFIHFAHIWCTRISISRAFNRILTDVHSLEHFRIIGST
ncbi:unnamed protein product [Rotaria sordida]|uniref:Uncharacterized protein n=1 Tax=Rotaria sordida TaxID=392033 RepID=A0A819JLR0_9BILA|nr:unnamed protein product [Rotaria sordida]